MYFQILRGDVDIDKISSLKVISTTWKLYLEEAPEAFEVIAYDDTGWCLALHFLISSFILFKYTLFYIKTQ